MKFSYTTKRYAEGFYVFVACVILFVAVLVAFVNLIVSLIIALVGILMVTSKYKLDIDLDNKTIDDYTWVLGAKTQAEHFRFQQLFYIYLTKKKFTQQMNARSQSAVRKGIQYTAYLKSDKDNHYLGESENETKLLAKVQPIANDLNLKVNTPD